MVNTGSGRAAQGAATGAGGSPAGTDPGPAGPDVLDSGSRRHRWPWLAVIAVVVAALVWWDLDGPPPVRSPIAAPTTAAIPTGVAQRVVPTPDRAENLTYADERTGFLVQWVCSADSPQGACPRQILATDDGGASWEARGRLPDAARYLDRFVVVSPTVLAVVGDFAPATIAVSYDAGRTFAMRSLDRGPARPARADAPVVSDGGETCEQVACPPRLSWLDVTNLTLHPLPTQVQAENLALVRTSSRAIDGDLVVSAAAVTTGRVWFTRDGGASWREAELPVPLQDGQALGDLNALVAGGGVAYVFAEVRDRTGVSDIYGFRTVDGGRRWTPTGFQDESLWRPAGVLDGELITTDNPGTVFLSTDGASRWEPAGLLPAPAYLSQARPGGPVLATLVGQDGLQTYYQTDEGALWTLVPVPPPTE